VVKQESLRELKATFTMTLITVSYLGGWFLAGWFGGQLVNGLLALAVGAYIYYKVFPWGETYARFRK